MRRLVVAVGLFLFVTLGFSQQFIADYSVAKEEVLRSIPQQYIDYARDNYKIAYFHTSHGTQVYYGLNGLPDYKAGDDALFGITNDNPEDGKLEFHDRNGWDLSDPADAFISITRSFLDDAENADINVVMWSWCDDAGHDFDDNYFPGMDSLINEYGEGGSNIISGDRTTPVKFIFMTGHAIKDENLGSKNPEMQARLINDHCNTHQYFCLDYYSIDTHTMSDVYYNDTGDNGDSDTYGGNFYQDFQDENTIGDGYYENKKTPGGIVTYGGHNTQHITSNRKAYAMWWILARMAGWTDVSTNSAIRVKKKIDIVYNQSLNQLTLNDAITEGSVCRVYNLTGSLCFEQKVNSSSISLANLHRGLYIVSLNTAKGVVTKKILIRD